MDSLKKFPLVLLTATEKGIEGMLSYVVKGGKWERLIVMSRGLCGNKYFDTTGYEQLFEYEPQHLYLVSNEAVLKGDYYIYERKVYKALTADDTLGKESDCAKILASTDKKLGLPVASNSFLEKYTNSYRNVESTDFEDFIKEAVLSEEAINLVKELLRLDLENLPFEDKKPVLTKLFDLGLISKVDDYTDFVNSVLGYQAETIYMEWNKEELV